MNKQFKTNVSILPTGALAEALGVHQRTLRIYDREGILSPKRSAKNRRNYTLDDLEKGRLILFLTRNLAVNIAGIKVILAMLEDNKINPQDYLAYIEKIAKNTNIDEKTQEENLLKVSRKGWKKKN